MLGGRPASLLDCEGPCPQMSQRPTSPPDSPIIDAIPTALSPKSVASPTGNSSEQISIIEEAIIVSDPRKKLLMRLDRNGLLNAARPSSPSSTMDSRQQDDTDSETAAPGPPEEASTLDSSEPLPNSEACPEPDAQKAIVSDPRRKLLMRLDQSGLLNGDQERRRQIRDLKAYPDIAALAHVAKTKENFYEIMGSPQVSCAREPKELPEGGYPSISGTAVTTLSPVSTNTGPDTGCASADDYPSPEMLPRSYAEVNAFYLDEDTDAEALAWALPNGPHTKSPASSGRGPSTPPPGGRTQQENFGGVAASERADLFWNLAGKGSPKLRPLDHLEMETDGSTKTGVYLLSSPKTGPCGDFFAPFQSIFKPLDEEVFERRGIEIGMGALREEAAFVIDRSSGGQAYVPTTTRASIEEAGVRKKGSVQQFVEGSVGPVEDFGMPRELQAAEAMVGLDNAQAVACFDIRIFNTDRHAGNLLLAGPRPHKIVCIDHGCVLPAWWALESSRFDAWMDWPHVRAPTSAATLSLVTQVGSTLPLVVQELEELGLSKQAIWTLEICTLLLQKCVLNHGLTLRCVALLMTRSDPAEPCWLERRVADACNAAGVTAEFLPEGKYGDLMLKVDQKILNHFTVNCNSEGTNVDKHLMNFRDAFFLFLDGAFSHTDVIRAAQTAEDATRNPWD